MYLGHRTDQHGLHPVQDKVEAILKARSPENVPELQALLGLLNYYGRFLYNLLTMLSNYCATCRQKFFWEPQQQLSFQRAKELLSAEVLERFDPTKQYCCSAN